MFISPGVTSYQDFNLGYRIYTVDGNYSNSTHTVLDHETYILDIAKARNLSDDSTPQWELEYAAKVRGRGVAWAGLAEWNLERGVAWEGLAE